MRRKIIAALIVSILVLSGCAGKKGNTGNSASGNLQGSGTVSTQQTGIQTDFKPIDPNTVPQLSAKQKSQVNTKLNTALDNIDKALKSIQDPKDIDTSSVN